MRPGAATSWPSWIERKRHAAARLNPDRYCSAGSSSASVGSPPDQVEGGSLAGDDSPLASSIDSSLVLSGLPRPIGGLASGAMAQPPQIRSHLAPYALLGA